MCTKDGIEKSKKVTIVLTPHIVANAPQMTNIEFGDMFFWCLNYFHLKELVRYLQFRRAENANFFKLC